MKRAPNFIRVTWGTGVTVLTLIGILSLGSAPIVRARQALTVAAAPKPGGSVNIRAQGVPDCLDPQKTQLAAVGDLDFAIFDTMVTLDEKGKLRPALATKWSFANGNKSITFSIRHGVRFSNGDALDAAAVKRSFDRILNPATKAGVAGGDLGTLKSVKTLGAYTVRFTMAAPFRPFMTNLSLAYLGILDVKAANKQGDRVCQSPVGSGPFKVSSVGPGFNTIRLVRNSYHTWALPWAQNKGAAYLSSITFKPIADDTTSTSELLSGGTDISLIAGSQFSRVQNQSGIKLRKFLFQREFYFSFNISHPPFNDVAVRRAVAQSVNRSSVIQAAINGQGTPVYSPVPPSLPYWDKAAKGYAPKYNTSEAQKTLASHGANGDYTLLTFSEAEGTTAAEFLQATFQQVGLKTKVVSKPSVDTIAQAETSNFDMLFFGWQYADPDILYLLFDSSQQKHGGLDYLFHAYPELDKLIRQGRTTLDPKKAAVIYAKVQKFLVSNALMVPLYDPIGYTAVRSRVAGYHANHANQVPYQDLYIK